MTEEKRGPGRPPKKVQQEAVEPLQVAEIKHVIRTLNWAGEFVEGSQPATVIEDHLNQNYFSQGYSLESVHTLDTVKGEGNKPFGNILLYILVK